MERHEKSALLGESIKAKSASPEGFSVTDCPEGGTAKAAHQRCRQMIKSGELFKARVHYRLIRYFDTQSGADAYLAENRMVKVPKPQPTVSLSQNLYEKRVTKKIINATVLRKDAEIIYPPGYKHSYHPMASPRNQEVTHSFVHSGLRAMP